MLRKLSQRINSEQKGFTLIELLVVILIIGILAAIALPAFLGQQQKGQDADAKSAARNLVSQVESCYAVEETYADCGTADLENTGLDLGTGKGQVDAVPSGTTGYVVTAYSQSNTNFTITKDAATGAITRDCTDPGKGGCKKTAVNGHQW
jgi:type IV pilus assembly protein PilA